MEWPKSRRARGDQADMHRPSFAANYSNLGKRHWQERALHRLRPEQGGQNPADAIRHPQTIRLGTCARPDMKWGPDRHERSGTAPCVKRGQLELTVSCRNCDSGKRKTDPTKALPRAVSSGGGSDSGGTV